MVMKWAGIGACCCLLLGSAVVSAAEVEASAPTPEGETTESPVETHKPVQAITYNVKLRSIEERVNELKEKIQKVELVKVMGNCNKNIYRLLFICYFLPRNLC